MSEIEEFKDVTFDLVKVKKKDFDNMNNRYETQIFYLYL